MDLIALPRLQVLYVELRYGDIEKVMPIEYPLPEKMQSEREMITQVKQLHCPDLYDVWIHPEHAWNYVREDAIWTPKRRIVGIYDLL